MTLLSRFPIWRIAFVSMLMTLGIFGMFKWALWYGADEATARTLAVNTLVVMEALFDTRPLGVMQGLPVLAAGVLLFAVLEIEKQVRRRRGSQSP